MDWCTVQHLFFQTPLPNLGNNRPQNDVNHPSARHRRKFWILRAVLNKILHKKHVLKHFYWDFGHLDVCELDQTLNFDPVTTAERPSFMQSPTMSAIKVNFMDSMSSVKLLLPVEKVATKTCSHHTFFSQTFFSFLRCSTNEFSLRQFR